MKTEATVIGVDIGGTWIRVALADKSGIIATESTGWPFGLSPAEEVNFIGDIAMKLAVKWGKADSVLAAGVSLAAMVDVGGTVVTWPNHPHWQKLPFKTILEARLGVPIKVEDDANAAALAEWQFGAGRGYHSLIVIMAGTGVGCGLVLNGILFRGQTGWAGELGHVVMLPDGMECPCGHRGCLQTVASGRALERVAFARNLPNVAALVNASDEGQLWASAELANCGGWLGLAAANVANLLDLQAVIIGGRLSANSAVWNSLTERFYSNLLNPNHRQVNLHRATLSETAGLRGATSLAWQQLGGEHEAATGKQHI
jgi:glucokinase